jgi:hypothetical protein
LLGSPPELEITKLRDEFVHPQGLRSIAPKDWEDVSVDMV